MIHTITFDKAIGGEINAPLLDIRSPAEYAKGHIPGALSLPLFSDDQRAVVGTTYNHQGRQAAILKGFDITGPKWSGYIKKALELAPDQKVILHCWRGGMRSEAMAWALSLYGFEVYVIKGGYKAFRRWAHALFSQPLNLVVLSGKTGSNKTGILQALARRQQVLDLEALACHQGSAYGSMGRLIQPTQEQFENNLAWQLKDLDCSKTVWIEDESITIGRCAVPGGLWTQLCAAPAVELEVPLEARVDILNSQYGVLDKAFLTEATLKIKKRLGPDQTRAATEDIQSGNMRAFIRRVLTYYDKAYVKSRKPGTAKSWVTALSVTDPADVTGAADLLIQMVAQRSAATMQHAPIKTDDNTE